MAANPRIRVREATPADVDTIVDVYFAAFDDNIMNQLMYPNGVSEDSKKKFGSSFRQPAAAEGDAASAAKKGELLLCVAEYLPEGSSADGPGEIVAFAWWQLDRTPRTEEEWLNTPPFAATAESWGEDCDLSVVNLFIGGMTELQRKHAKGEAALYLKILACSPTRQRLGAGSALVQWGVNLADSLGLPCRLEASPVGYALYRKFGFEDVDVHDLNVAEIWGVSNVNGSNWGANNAVALAGPPPEGVMRTVIMRRPPKKQNPREICRRNLFQLANPVRMLHAPLLQSWRLPAAEQGASFHWQRSRQPLATPAQEGAQALRDATAFKCSTASMDPVSATANIVAIVQAANRVITLRTTALDALARDHGPIEGCRKAILELEHLLPSESIFSTESKRKALLTAIAWTLKDSKAKALLDELRGYKSTITLALTTDSVFDLKDIKASTEEIQTTTKVIHASLTDIQRQQVDSWLRVTDTSRLHEKSCAEYEPGTGEWLFRSPEWISWLEEKTRCLWVHGIPGAGKTVLASHLIETVKQHCGTRGRDYACAYYYCYFGHAQNEAAPMLRSVLSQLCRQLGDVPIAVYELYRQGGEPSLASLLLALGKVVQAFHRVFLFVDAVDESSPRQDLLRVLRDLAVDPQFDMVRVLATSREYVDIEEVMLEISTPISMRNELLDEDITRYVEAKLEQNRRVRRWPQSVREEAARALSAKAGGMFRWVVCQIDALQRLKPERSIIQAALADLPRTLDETYERVLLRIPEEARSFVQHVLRWMSTHRAIHHNIPGVQRTFGCSLSAVDIESATNIPCAILFRAVEESLSREDSSDNIVMSGYLIDEELLREFCGCLVTLTRYRVRDPTTTEEMTEVSFAHYTVLEFLDSARIRRGPVAAFALDRDRVMADHAAMLFQGAVAEMDRWASDVPRHRGLDFYTDFERYCAHASAMILHWHARMLESSGTAAWMTPVVQLLEPRTASLGSYFWYDDNLNSYDSPMASAILAFRRTHRLKFLCYLARAFLARLGLGNDAFASKIEVQFEPGTRYQDFTNNSWATSTDRIGRRDIFSFRGSALEFYAQLPGLATHQGLSEILDSLAGRFDPSTLMLLAIAHHIHSPWEVESYCWGCCVLRQLLQLGARSTVPGYAVGSLQIAASMLDVAGVKLLLEAGIDPNDVGDVNGEIGTPDKGPMLGWFGRMRGKSPLRIVRSGDYAELGHDWFLVSGTGDTRPTQLEAILMQYGGRDFDQVSLMENLQSGTQALEDAVEDARQPEGKEGLDGVLMQDLPVFPRLTSNL
ncbi:uncharacterized protein THITE_72721 [Thermothielavioides terrestris NRRL 8126]|uniref:NACHT domain-containing protein n=1 Tax=Thermothielavioides terrestris (strain ATCC 38088 / NRRL 8126) TaxID=578455 RepID=G2RCE5_THETT|nr:uncharacterized protein THITE_72721 [Thermothielavioides terrestris NRRL 8126]AEO70580.1 hypothetical protein THITE_72721 [Thermothielavioides terrestris NRRL 8126]